MKDFYENVDEEYIEFPFENSIDNPEIEFKLLILDKKTKVESVLGKTILNIHKLRSLKKK